MNNSLRINATSSVGFLVGIGAWSMTFITLIWGYLFYRLRIGQWLMKFITEDVLKQAVVNSIVLVLSSLVLHKFLDNKQKLLFLFGNLLGLLFIFGQLDLWLMLLSQGLSLKSSLAGSFLYLLTGFHAIHILVGLTILFPLGFKICQQTVNDRDESRFSFALKFWDLLMFFWLVLFVVIFILK